MDAKGVVLGTTVLVVALSASGPSQASDWQSHQYVQLRKDIGAMTDDGMGPVGVAEVVSALSDDPRLVTVAGLHKPDGLSLEEQMLVEATGTRLAAVLPEVLSKAGIVVTDNDVVRVRADALHTPQVRQLLDELVREVRPPAGTHGCSKSKALFVGGTPAGLLEAMSRQVGYRLTRTASLYRSTLLEIVEAPGGYRVKVSPGTYKETGTTVRRTVQVVGVAETTSREGQIAWTCYGHKARVEFGLRFPLKGRAHPHISRPQMSFFAGNRAVLDWTPLRRR